MGGKGYYTPDISEFYVGFIFERQVGFSNIETSEEYTGGIVEEVDDSQWRKTITTINNYKVIGELLLETSYIRVKYLDTSDIESLGFTYDSNSKIYKRGEYRLHINNEEDYVQRLLKVSIWTSTSNPGYSDIIFYGVIKNKSELIIVLKQIGIL